MPGALEAFTPVKALFLRAIGLSLLVWVALEAWAGRAPRGGLTTLSVLLWTGAAGVATLFSLSPHLSFMGEIGQREGLLTVLALAGLHLATSRSHRVESDVRDTLRVVVVCALVAALYAQLQLAGLDPIAWSGVHTFSANGAIVLRPAGPLGNPILLGIVLAAALPILLVRLAGEASDAALLVPAAALLSASLVMTLSRGAWLAAAFGGVVTIVLALRAGARAPRVAWTLAASLSPAFVFGVARAYAPLVARLTEGSEGGSGATRMSIARGALQLWSERPWLGVGPDAFGLAYPRVQEVALWRSEWVGMPVHAHSVPLQVLATMGLIGTLAGIAWLVSAAEGLWRAWREVPGSRHVIAGLAGALAALIGAGSVNVVGLAGAALFAVCTALTGALNGSSDPATRPLRPMHPAAPAIAAAVMCWFQLSSGVLELGAQVLARPAREVLNRANATPGAGQALAAARAAAAQRAVSLWPHDDALWRLACQASLAQGVASAGAVRADSLAESDARRAVALEPRRAEGFACLGDAFAARALRTGTAAYADSATTAYEFATGLAPANGWLMVSHVRFQLARRDGAKALEVAQRITGLYPEAAVGHTLSGAALVLLHRPVEARTELSRSLAARWEEDAGAQRAAVERLLGSLNPAAAAAPKAAASARSRGESPRR